MRQDDGEHQGHPVLSLVTRQQQWLQSRVNDEWGKGVDGMHLCRLLAGDVSQLLRPGVLGPRIL